MIPIEKEFKASKKIVRKRGERSVKKHSGASKWAVKKAGAGIVSYCVDSSTGKAKHHEMSPSCLVEALRVGLPVNELQDLQTRLDVPMEKLAPILGISKATLHRRKESGKLDVSESDRVIRFARLLGRAIETMEDEEAARQWLRSPQVGLGGAIPLEYAETEVGAREVENLLGRIDLGVYS
jgi:putative toxin-antitoxin system antitoxin component (TIGR02293 family)